MSDVIDLSTEAGREEARRILKQSKEQREAEHRAANERDKAAAEAKAKASVSKEAAALATEEWETASALPAKHPYTESHQIGQHGARLDKEGNLLLAGMDTDGAVHTLYRITPEGRGYFMRHGRKKGRFFPIGDMHEAPLIAVTSDFSSAAVIHEATAYPIAVAFDSSNLVAVVGALRTAFPSTELVVCGNDDIHVDDNPGRTRATIAARAGRAALCMPDAPSFYELAQDHGLAGVRTAIEARRPISEIDDVLIYGASGQVRTCMHNVAVLLATDNAWRGVLAWDDFAMRLVKLKAPPFDGGTVGPWTDFDDLSAASWIARHHNIAPGPSMVSEAALLTGSRRKIDPVTSYLDSLTWDGTERLDHWLSDVASAESSEYTQTIGRRYLIGAVARVRKPGAKFDSVLMLEGPQGLMKSTLLRVLASDDWFCDEPIDFTSKDGMLLLQGHWIVEMAELESMSKATAEQAKLFLSKTRDTFRPPYGRALVTRQRRCVFAGTTNPAVYLKDQTGNRRFWPIECHEIRLDVMAEMRDQLWAEADAAYRGGERWWLDGKHDAHIIAQANEIAEQRVHTDPWEDLIAAWLEAPNQASRESVTASEIISECLRIESGRQDRSAQMRIASVMQRLGWQKGCRTMISGVRVWPYKRRK